MADPWASVLKNTLPIFIRNPRISIGNGQGTLVNAKEKVQFLDLSEPFKPVLKGTLLEPGEPLDIKLSGSHACLAEYKGFRVVDVSDPARQSRIGRFRYFQSFHAGQGLVVLDASKTNAPPIRIGGLNVNGALDR